MRCSLVLQGNGYTASCERIGPRDKVGIVDVKIDTSERSSGINCVILECLIVCCNGFVIWYLL